jgi:regulator of replication initiation timing
MRLIFVSFFLSGVGAIYFEINHNLFSALEEQKTRLNKLLESNDALKVDLQELEGNIGLLVKNFRSIKDHSDKKAEQERKQEVAF